jgi:uncharacterized surface protein with fasciclin (FAS1) repeats
LADNEGINQDQTVSSGIDERLQTKLIAETVNELDGCQSFAEWMRKQGLEYILRRSGLHTLFVPTNNAFRPPASEDPEQYLNRHLLRGGAESFDLSRCSCVKSVAGERLPVAERGTQVGGARIIRADVPCTNGVVHIVDAEFQPVKIN